MKDYWYTVHDTVHPEAKVYKKLKEAGVPFVATLVTGGDVHDVSAPKSGGAVDKVSVEEPSRQETFMPSKALTENELLKRRHHRIVVEEIGRPLKEYPASGRLILFVYGALTGELPSCLLSRSISNL